VRVAVIINPAAGRAPGRERARRRANLAVAVLEAANATPDVVLTEAPGHAGDLARSAVERGAGLVIAWGGDGTVNEVGSALVGGDVPLGIVPAGSGNGLASALGIPRRAAAALQHALVAPERRIDVGEIDGRLFLNIAGIGFDARIADRFARDGGKRGLRRYATMVARELFTYRASPCQLTIDGCVSDHVSILLVIANGPQWGNGARIAPHAKLDDGLLDVVSVAARSPLRAAWYIPRLFTGTIGTVPGVTTERVTSLEISGRAPLTFHVDGQPGRSESGNVAVRVRPGALLVRA
jgi:YegS/Rv2252/BmrU family lipid kinase